MDLGPRKPVFGECKQQGLRLISAFIIHIFKSIISKLATSEISFFLLVSVAVETGLSLALSKTLQTGYVRSKPI